MKMAIVTSNDFIDTYVLKSVGRSTLEKYSHWFPLYASKTLAEIVADISTDGYMQIRNKKNGNKDYKYFAFFSKYNSEILKFINKVHSIFRVSSEPKDVGKRDFGTSLGCEFWNAPLTRVMSLCGVPANDKVVNTFDFPSRVENCNKDIKSGFLCRAFTCDGSISFDKSKDKWEIRFYMCKSKELLENGFNYMNSIRAILKSDFDIKTTNTFIYDRHVRTKDDVESIGLCFKIYKVKSIIKFKKYVGFDINIKVDKLNKAAQEIK